MQEMRKWFEEVSCPSFGHELVFTRKQTGEYFNPVLEDHWQTFQEGWESAIKHLHSKNTGKYSDVVSTGGMDPR